MESNLKVNKWICIPAAVHDFILWTFSFYGVQVKLPGLLRIIRSKDAETYRELSKSEGQKLQESRGALLLRIDYL